MEKQYRLKTKLGLTKSDDFAQFIYGIGLES
jgi:hypothetical protein